MTLTSFVFANNGWCEADLFSITLPNGTVIRATNHNVDLVGPDANTYYSSLYGKWERSGISFERTIVTTCNVTVTADSTVMFPGTTTPMLWVSKLFARSSVTITTCTIDTTAPTTIVGSVVVFVGRCTAPSMTSTQVNLKCADETYLLLEPWPRRVICAGCPFTLFDSGCTLNRDSFAISCAVGAGSTQTNLVLGQNKNVLLWSEQFDNAAWGKGTNVTVTPNTTADPNGNLTADTIATGATANQGVFQFSSMPAANGTPVTFAVWLKAAGSVAATLLIERSGGSDIESHGITITTDWQPYTFTHSATWTGTTGIGAVIHITNSATSIFAWGAQLEVGSVATTYVQTTVATTLTLGSVGNDSLPYSKGYIVPTSGQAVGWPIMVTLQSDATHLNVQPFPLPFAVGDAFTLYPGCNGTLSACEFKFSNRTNFGGFSNVPGPSGAISATGN